MSVEKVTKASLLAIFVACSSLLGGMDRSDADKTAGGMMAEMSEGFPHPFFNHMGIPDMSGMASVRVTGYRQGGNSEPSQEDFGFHLEAGLYERLGIHIRNNEIRQSPRTDVMLMYAVVQDDEAQSGVSLFAGALIPSGTIPKGEDEVVGAFGVSGRQFVSGLAVFDGNVHYMPEMKMFEMGFSGVFKATEKLFPIIEIEGKVTEQKTMFYLFPSLKFKLKPEVFIGVGTEFAITQDKEFDSRFLVQMDMAW